MEKAKHIYKWRINKEKMVYLSDSTTGQYIPFIYDKSENSKIILDYNTPTFTRKITGQTVDEEAILTNVNQINVMQYNVAFKTMLQLLSYDDDGKTMLFDDYFTYFNVEHNISMPTVKEVVHFPIGLEMHSYGDSGISIYNDGEKDVIDITSEKGKDGYYFYLTNPTVYASKKSILTNSGNTFITEVRGYKGNVDISSQITITGVTGSCGTDVIMVTGATSSTPNIIGITLSGDTNESTRRYADVKLSAICDDIVVSLTWPLYILELTLSGVSGGSIYQTYSSITMMFEDVYTSAKTIYDQYASGVNFTITNEIEGLSTEIIASGDTYYRQLKNSITSEKNTFIQTSDSIIQTFENDAADLLHQVTLDTSGYTNLLTADAEHYKNENISDGGSTMQRIDNKYSAESFIIEQRASAFTYTLSQSGQVISQFIQNSAGFDFSTITGPEEFKGVSHSIKGDDISSVFIGNYESADNGRMQIRITGTGNLGDITQQKLSKNPETIPVYSIFLDEEEEPGGGEITEPGEVTGSTGGTSTTTTTVAPETTTTTYRPPQSVVDAKDAFIVILNRNDQAGNAWKLRRYNNGNYYITNLDNSVTIDKGLVLGFYFDGYENGFGVDIFKYYSGYTGYGHFNLTANGLINEVGNVDGMIGRLEQTADGISQKVELASSITSQIIQTASGFSIEYKRYDESAETFSEQYINISQNNTTIYSPEIDINGYTSFNGDVQITEEGKLILNNANVEGVLSSPVQKVTGDTVILQDYSSLYARDRNVNIFLPCEPNYLGRQLTAIHQSSAVTNYAYIYAGHALAKTPYIPTAFLDKRGDFDNNIIGPYSITTAETASENFITINDAEIVGAARITYDNQITKDTSATAVKEALYLGNALIAANNINEWTLDEAMPIYTGNYASFDDTTEKPYQFSNMPKVDDEVPDTIKINNGAVELTSLPTNRYGILPKYQYEMTENGLPVVGTYAGFPFLYPILEKNGVTYKPSSRIYPRTAISNFITSNWRQAGSISAYTPVLNEEYKNQYNIYFSKEGHRLYEFPKGTKINMGSYSGNHYAYDYNGTYPRKTIYLYDNIRINDDETTGGKAVESMSFVSPFTAATGEKISVLAKTIKQNGKTYFLGVEGTENEERVIYPIFTKEDGGKYYYNPVSYIYRSQLYGNVTGTTWTSYEEDDILRKKVAKIGNDYNLVAYDTENKRYVETNYDDTVLLIIRENASKLTPTHDNLNSDIFCQLPFCKWYFINSNSSHENSIVTEYHNGRVVNAASEQPPEAEDPGGGGNSGTTTTTQASI